MKQSNVELLLKFVVKDILDKSDFLKDASHKVTDTIINNNIVAILDEKKVTKFRKLSELGMIEQHLKPIMRQEDFNEDVFKKEIADTFSSSASAAYNSIVTSFINNLNKTKNELSTVHDTVTGLVSKFDILYAKYQTTPPGTTSHKDYSLSYEEWNDMSVLGPEDTIVEEINNYCGIESDKILIQSFNNFIAKMKINLYTQTAEFKNAVVDDEKREKINEAITASSGLSLKQSREMLDVVISKTGMNHLISMIDTMGAGVTKEYFARITDTMNMVTKFLNGYERKIASQKDASIFLDNDTVKYNVNFLSNIQKAIIYIKSFYRYQNWKNHIILPTGKINTDLTEKGAAAGIDKNTLKLFVVSSDFTQPGTSYTIQNMVEKKELFAKIQHNKEVAYNRSVVQTEKETKEAALCNVITNYLKGKKVENALPTAVKLSKEAVNLLLPVEVSLYKAVIQIENIGTWSKELYDEFGAEFNQLSASATEVTKQMVQEVKAKVLTKKITNFLIENSCN